MADARQASIERALVALLRFVVIAERGDVYSPTLDDYDCAIAGRDALHSLASALAEAERERDDYRRANEAVRVCAAHTTEIVDAPLDCWVCEYDREKERLHGLLAEAERQRDDLQEAGKTLVAECDRLFADGKAAEAALADTQQRLQALEARLRRAEEGWHDG